MSDASTELVREAEFRKCARDPRYFINNYVHISTPDRGRILMDTTNRPYQDLTIRHLHGDFGRKSINLKSRQLGITTTCAAYCLWAAFFNADQYILFISRREADAKDILRKTDYAWKFLPPWMIARGPTRLDDAAQRMTFSNDSLIRSEPSQSDPARGQTATLIIVDEFASLPDQEDAWASIEPVADIGGRLFLLSTAKGFGDQFHSMWTGAELGSNGFAPLFFPWSVVPSRDEAWFEEKCRNMLPWQRAQEYPSSPEEAFVQSGNMVFDLDSLRRQEVGVKVPELLRLDAEGGVLPYTGTMREPPRRGNAHGSIITMP